MQKKYLIITDTHLSVNKTKTCFDFFEYLCNYAKENNIKNLIHLGDFFNDRKNLSLILIPVIHKIGKMLNDTFDQSYIISGNHDLFYNDRLDVCSLDLLKFYENINVLKKPFELNENTILCPWLIDSNIDHLKKYENIMGHFEINGIVLNRSGTLSEKCSLSQSDFSKFKNVFSGHYHTPGNYGNIVYLGAPYHMSFNDGGERGFYIWDGKNIDFIEYSNYNKFVIINQDDPIDKELIENNHIRLDINKKLSKDEIDNKSKEINELNPKSFKIKFNIKDSTCDVEDIKPDVIIDNKELLHTFFDKYDRPDYINGKVLKLFIDMLLEE